MCSDLCHIAPASELSVLPVYLCVHSLKTLPSSRAYRNALIPTKFTQEMKIQKCSPEAHILDNLVDELGGERGEIGRVLGESRADLDTS